jgi:predicted aldo/keto reductase-like oxidoreductase
LRRYLKMFEKDKKLSRRQLLKGAGAASLGSFLLSTGLVARVSGEATGVSARRGVVPTRPFGHTGVHVSSLALGGMFDIPNNQLLLKQALDWGVTYWDTADCYGRGKSEKGIGKFFSRNPEARQKVFLVTKSDDRDAEGRTRLLNRSLERMKTDYIDLYLVHGLSDISEVDSETRGWVKHAKAQGKIKLFGFSTHRNMEDCLLAAADLGWIDGIMMSYNFRLMHSAKMKAAVDACGRARIGLTAMKTQGGGTVRVENEAELKMAGRFLQQGFTDKQARLKAVWENPHIASICSQMPNLTILMSNVAAVLNQTKLSAVDRELMEEYAHETRSTYCAACAHICEPAVEGKVPISDVMRYLMYYHNYEDHDRARPLFEGLPKATVSRLASLDFSTAERRCPQKLRIGKLMKGAAQVLA